MKVTEKDLDDIIALYERIKTYAIYRIIKRAKHV